MNSDNFLWFISYIGGKRNFTDDEAEQVFYGLEAMHPDGKFLLMHKAFYKPGAVPGDPNNGVVAAIVRSPYVPSEYDMPWFSLYLDHPVLQLATRLTPFNQFEIEGLTLAHDWLNRIRREMGVPPQEG